MQIFVSGTWKPEKASPYRTQGIELGRLLAENGLDLACGPGTGIARHVIDGYRSVEDRGQVRIYLPQKEAMDRAGEVVQSGADEIEQTDFDYPMRNVYQVKKSHGLFVLTGGDGALEEILPAVIDYRIPIAVVERSGSASEATRALLEIYPEWKELIGMGPDVSRLFPAFLERVRNSCSSG